MIAYLFFGLLLGLIYPASANATEVKDATAEYKVLKIEAIQNGQSIDDFLGIPDIKEDPPERNEDRVCKYECTLAFEREKSRGSRLASFTWMHTYGSQLLNCACPSSDAIGRERACPVILEGNSAEIRVPCSTP